MTAATISLEIIKQLPNFRAALRACVMFSGKPLKEVAFDLEIEVSHLSKMLNDSPEPRHFPPNKLVDLMRICGNHVPLRWLANACGLPDPISLERLQEEKGRLQEEIAQLHEALNHSKGEAKYVMNVFKNFEVKE